MPHAVSFPTPVFAATQPAKVNPLPIAQKFVEDGNATAHERTGQTDRVRLEEKELRKAAIKHTKALKGNNGANASWGDEERRFRELVQNRRWREGK